MPADSEERYLIAQPKTPQTFNYGTVSHGLRNYKFRHIMKNHCRNLIINKRHTSDLLIK